MGPIRRFEDLLAWQVSRELASQVYRITRRGEFARDWKLSAQVQSAAVSITSNIAEGFERGSAAEFHKFLVIAKASCAEVRSQLYIASDIGYLTPEEFGKLQMLSERASCLVGALRESVRKNIKS
jgi:four helix bundle protein